MSIFTPQRSGVVLAVTAIALLASGSGRDRAALPPAMGRAPSPVAAVPGGAASASRVVLASGHRRNGVLELRATVRGARARIVALTFYAGSYALGTDTVAPYRLDVLSSQLPSRSASVHAVAVDRLGRRKRSATVLVRRGGTGRIVRATPERGLARAIDALRRGGATIRLGPGRYAVDPVSVGSNTRLVGAGPATGTLAPRTPTMLRTSAG